MPIHLNRIFMLLSLCIGLVGTSHASALTQELATIPGFYQSTAQLYSAGQPEPEAFKALAEAGVRHVINLRPPTEQPGFNEAAVVTQNRMAYYNIPIAGAGDLDRDKVVLLDGLLQQLKGEKVLVHCSSSNRVGALLALRAVWIDGQSTTTAIELGLQHGLTRLQAAVEKLLAME